MVDFAELNSMLERGVKDPEAAAAFMQQSGLNDWLEKSGKAIIGTAIEEAKSMSPHLPFHVAIGVVSIALVTTACAVVGASFEEAKQKEIKHNLKLIIGD